MSETYELWSWSEQHQCWLAVSQGTEAEVMDGAVRRTDAARKYGLWGAAFVCCKVGARPHGSPAELGVDVVTEPKRAGRFDDVAPAAGGDDDDELERLRADVAMYRDWCARLPTYEHECVCGRRFSLRSTPALAHELAKLERLRGIEQRARDFLERPGISSAEAIATARYIVTGDPGA